MASPSLPEHPEVQFNLSHTRGAVLVGIHDRPHRRGYRAYPAVSERTMQRLAGAVTEREFFESWTRRESRAKWGGRRPCRDEEGGLAHDARRAL